MALRERWPGDGRLWRLSGDRTRPVGLQPGEELDGARGPSDFGFHDPPGLTQADFLLPQARRTEAPSGPHCDADTAGCSRLLHSYPDPRSARRAFGFRSFQLQVEPAIAPARVLEPNVLIEVTRAGTNPEHATV